MYRAHTYMQDERIPRLYGVSGLSLGRFQAKTKGKPRQPPTGLICALRACGCGLKRPFADYPGGTPAILFMASGSGRVPVQA